MPPLHTVAYMSALYLDMSGWVRLLAVRSSASAAWRTIKGNRFKMNFRTMLDARPCGGIRNGSEQRQCDPQRSMTVTNESGRLILFGICLKSTENLKSV
jgi:hypothetical protein